MTFVTPGTGRQSEYKAVVAELVDALDLGSSVFGVRVRVSPTAPYNRHFPIESPMRIRKQQRKACKFQ